MFKNAISDPEMKFDIYLSDDELVTVFSDICLKLDKYGLSTLEYKMYEAIMEKIKLGIASEETQQDDENNKDNENDEDDELRKYSSIHWGNVGNFNLNPYWGSNGKDFKNIGDDHIDNSDDDSKE